jgi:hypothetical protein
MFHNNEDHPHHVLGRTRSLHRPAELAFPASITLLLSIPHQWIGDTRLMLQWDARL